MNVYDLITGFREKRQNKTNQQQHNNNNNDDNDDDDNSDYEDDRIGNYNTIYYILKNIT